MDLAGFLADPTGIAIQTLLGLTLVTFLLGVFAAVRDGTFDWKYIDAFVRSTVAGKVGPCAVVLLAGYLTQNVALLAIGTAFTGVVTTGMLAAIKDSLLQFGMTATKSAATNTVPTT